MSNMAYVFICLLIVLDLNLVKGKEGICARFANGCCPNTKWDTEIEACVACQDGYYWLNCTKQCPFPRYGKTCKHICSCDKQSCDFIVGCREDDEGAAIDNKSPLYFPIIVTASMLILLFIAIIAVTSVDKYRNFQTMKSRNKVSHVRTV